MKSSLKRIEIQKRAALLRTAAELLQEDATAEEESCSFGEKLWTCGSCVRDADGKCQAMRNTEARRLAAAGLVEMAGAM